MWKQWWACAFVLITTVGCGDGVIAPKVDQGKFEPYVVAFEATARVYGLDFKGALAAMPISFGAVHNEGSYGECRWDALGSKSITIVEEKWKQMDSETQESLIFHELGHCALGRPHEEGNLRLETHGSTSPQSLMNHILVDGKTYASRRDYYQEELFTPVATWFTLKEMTGFPHSLY